MLNFCTSSLPLPRQFTHYVRSSTCGERDLLSYIVDDPDLSRFDQVVGILLNDLNCFVTRSMAFRIWVRGNVLLGAQELRHADTVAEQNLPRGMPVLAAAEAVL